VNASSDAVKQLAGQVFRHVEQAYETLGDARRRQEYILNRKRADREAALREAGQRALAAERYFQQGEAALQQRAYETALRLFGQALELYHEEGEYHAHYGWTLHLCHPDSAEMAEEAIEHVKRGIKLASDREKPYLLMGRLCKAIGRPGAAEKPLQGDRPPRRGGEDVHARGAAPAGLPGGTARAPPHQHAATEGKELHRTAPPPVNAGGGPGPCPSSPSSRRPPCS
jgi:tetratricopeptide (TPR) repeat protein